MNCPDVQARLVDLLYGELPAEDCDAVTIHIERCPGCWAAWLEVRATASALDRWTPPTPAGIAERVLATLSVREAKAARAHAATTGLLHLFAFLLAGATAASVSLLLLGGGMHPEDTPLKVGLVGALWTALYGGVLFVTREGRYRRLALAALIAAGLSILFAPILSMPVVIEACRRWLEAAQSSVVLNMAIVLAGGLYAGAPVLASGAALVRTGRVATWADAGCLAAVYGLLLGPSVYLQCQTLTLSLTAPWVAGMLLGTFVGSFGGISIASRLRPAAG